MTGRDRPGGVLAGRDWPTTDLVAARAATTPEREAVADAPTGRSWTYRELDRWVDAVGARLAADDAIHGRVGVLSRPRPDVLAVVHACWRTGREFVGLHAGLAPGELAAQLATADVGVVLADDAGRDLASDAVGHADAPSRLDETDVHALAAVTDAADAGAAEGSGPDDRTASTVDVARDDVPVTLFTSGTTGEPKAVRLTVGNLLSSATASAFRLGVVRGDRWLSPLPTYHMGGLAPAIRCALYGATVVLQRGFDADATANALDEQEATGVSLVPTALGRLLDAGWTPDERLRFVLLGGAAASTDLLARCERADVPVHPSWGMTETASQIATATPEQVFADLGAVNEADTDAAGGDDADARPSAVTVGQPLLNTTVTVLGDDGTAVEPGVEGELVVDGPTVTPGYLDGDGSAFGPHGLHTGDRGYRDGDGKVYVTGRVDDLVVTGGENVQPTRVRAAIEAVEGVVDAAVVGIPDPEWGERVAALLTTSPGSDLDAQTVVDAVRDDLGDHEVPKTVAFADAIPRTASGTVDRDAVREALTAATRRDRDGA